MHWSEIPGWFRWRSGQEEAVQHFPENSRFVEVGTYLGRSLCSLGEVQADNTAWLPKIKPNGWLSGDDFDETKWPEVVRAVGELLPEAEPWSEMQWRWIVPASDPRPTRTPIA